MGHRKIITIIGSSRFVQTMAVVSWILERDEVAIVLSLHFLPDWYCQSISHAAESQGCADHFDELHFDKIRMADEVFVVDGVLGQTHIGKSTTRELELCQSLGKKVRWLSHGEDTINSEIRNAINAAIAREKGADDAK